MFGSTPSGSHKSYSYYITHTKLNDLTLRIQTHIADFQILNWLSGITIDPENIPTIREIYQNEIHKLTSENKEENLSQLKRKMLIFKKEEANLGRLLITSNISEATYGKLRS